MRNLGAYADANFPAWPDYINTVLPTSVGSIATFDYPLASTISSSSPQFVEVIAQGANVWFHPSSTGAIVPTTASLAGQGGQSLVSNAVPLKSGLPAGSTGGSVAFPSTTNAVTIKFWRK